MPKSMLGPLQRRARQVRRELAVRGLSEAVTYSFIPAAHAALFGAERPVRLLNPISAELDALRPSLLPGLLAAAQRNAARGLTDGAIFEVGPAFSGSEPGAQALMAAGLRLGLTRPRHWSGPPLPADAYAAKADAEAALLALGISPQSLQTVPGAQAWYHPGQSGSFKQGPKTLLASFGVLHPAVSEAMGLKGPAAAFEIYLEALPAEKARSKARPKLVLPDLMPLERDFAFIVDEAVAGGDIVKAAREADRALIAEVALFDIFAGGAVEKGKKSVAIAVRIQPQGKTLTDEEIEALGRKIVATVSKQTGARLRQ
jgi:phenylalanyl-tRNA synthetase beta chain